MAGVLQFALAIETAGFIRNMTGAGRSVLAFIGVAEAGRKVLEGFASAFEKSNRLYNQSMATGTKISSLYAVGEGLKAVGVSAEESQPLLFKMQKALSGMTDEGQKTDAVFAALHLNMQELAKSDPAKALVQITSTLHGLDQESRVGAASILFGREGAQQMVQIATQAQRFSVAIREAGAGGTVFQNFSAHFVQALRTVDEIKSHVEVGFASAAAGFVVPLQHALDNLKSIDFEKLGKSFGVVISSAFEAFNNGNFAIVLEESFAFAIKSAGIFARPIFESLGAAIIKGMLTAEQQESLRKAQSAASTPLADMYGSPLNVGVAAWQSDRIEARFRSGRITKAQYEKEMGVFNSPLFNSSNFPGDLGAGIDSQSMDDDVKNRTAEAEKQWAELRKNFTERLRQLAPSLGASVRPGASMGTGAGAGPKPGHIDFPSLTGGGGGGEGGAFGGAFHLNVNQWEKMGFVMNTGHGSSLDYARRTAVACERMANSYRPPMPAPPVPSRNRA